MSTHLLLRARRDFVAHSHTDVRLKNGEILDFASPAVQAFVRATLGWDAFAVEFIDDAIVIDPVKARAEADAVLALVQEAEAVHAAAAKEYEAAQVAVIEHDRKMIADANASVIAESEQSVDQLADANAKRGDLKRAEIAAGTRIRETAAALAKVAEEAGRLVVLVHSLRTESPESQTFIEQKVGKLDPIEILANATVDELAQLKGIGPKKAQEIIDAAQALVAERANPVDA